MCSRYAILLVLLAAVLPAFAKTARSAKTTQSTATQSKRHVVSHKTSPHGTAHRAASRTRRGKTTTSSKAAVRCRKGKKCAPASVKARGQQAIDSARTQEIQSALIREHYLAGEPTGVWDDATKQAFIKLQNENGWQTKIVPDSRALIKLGLGPDRSHLLNAEALQRAQGAREIVPGGAAVPQ